MTDPTSDALRRNRASLRLATQRWLGYERAQSDVLAEDALQQVFNFLPEPAPSAVFADRVMRALRPVSFIDRAAAHWGVRAAALLCLVQTALMFAALAMTAIVLGRHYGADSILVFAAQAGVTAMNVAGSMLAWLGKAGQVGQTLARALSSPAALLVASGCTLLAATTLYLLIRATSAGRRGRNGSKGDVGASAA